MGLMDLSSTLLSVVCSLIIGGAVYFLMKRRITALENLHVEQARLLKSFIAQQQAMLMSGGQPTMNNQMDRSTNEPVPANMEENPQTRILVSDGSEEEESDAGSYIEESDSADDRSSSGISDSESYVSDTIEQEAIPDVVASSAPVESAKVIHLEFGDDFPVADSEPINLSKMKVDNLRALSVEKGLFQSLDEAKKVKKNAIIDMLENVNSTVVEVSKEADVPSGVEMVEDDSGSQ